jgi:hypothetical protein
MKIIHDKGVPISTKIEDDDIKVGQPIYDLTFHHIPDECIYGNDGRCTVCAAHRPPPMR